MIPALETRQLKPEVEVRVTGAKTARRRQPRWWSRSMKMIRRVHLYSGLFLVPWVLLYGLTGYLFNHPASLAAGVTTSTVDAEEFSAVGFPESPIPAAMAAEVFAEWRAQRARQARQSGEPSASQASVFSIPSDGDATLSSRVFLSAGPARGESGTSLSLDVDASRVSGRLTTRVREPAERPAENPFRGVEKLAVGQDYAARLVEAGASLFEQRGYPNQKVRLRSAPTLEFDIEERKPTGATRRWRASYRLDRRTLSARPDDAAQGPAWRRFLTRLHVAHSYPVTGGPRWFWAIIVDVMAIAMMVWGVSGLLMWWQIKSLRRVGGVVLVACAVVAVWMTWGMYASMS